MLKPIWSGFLSTGWSGKSLASIELATEARGLRLLSEDCEEVEHEGPIVRLVGSATSMELLSPEELGGKSSQQEVPASTMLACPAGLAG